MADRGRTEAYHIAGPPGRTSGPRASAGTRHSATGRPGRVQAGAQAAGLAVRKPGGPSDGCSDFTGRDASARTVVGTRRPMVGGQSRTARGDADGRQRRRTGADTRNVRIADRGQARAARLLGRRQKQPAGRPATAETFGGRPTAAAGQGRR